MHAAHSAQRCRVGTTLPGLSRPSPSKAHLSAAAGRDLLPRTSRHQVAFLDPDAVFAGDHPADLDAQPKISAPNARPCRARPACWRRRGSADADCRRRHERHWSSAGHILPTSLDAAEHPRHARAEWCRPCSNSRARCGRRREKRPCGRSRTSAARLRSETLQASRGILRYPARLGDLRPLLRPSARRSATPRRRRIAGVDESLGGGDGGAIHHFDAAGMMPAPMIAATHCPGFGSRKEAPRARCAASSGSVP